LQVNGRLAILLLWGVVSLRRENMLDRTQESIMKNWNRVGPPLVSIACTTFNHEKFIAETIESFLMQCTNFPFEIIIHDDASTDSTKEIIKSYMERYPDIIKPIFQTVNQSSQRKSCFSIVISHGRGKYIALCEGDDFWADPEKLQLQVDYLEAHPECVVCYHDAMIVNDEGKLIKASKMPANFKRDCTDWELASGFFISTLTMVFRNVIKEFPYEMSNCKYGDIFLTSLLGGYGKGKYLGNIKPGVYRVHHGSICSTASPQNFNIYFFTSHYWISEYYRRIGNIKLSRVYGRSMVRCLLNNMIRPYMGLKDMILILLPPWLARRACKVYDVLCGRYFGRRL